MLQAQLEAEKAENARLRTKLESFAGHEDEEDAQDAHGKVASEKGSLTLYEMFFWLDKTHPELFNALTALAPVFLCIQWYLSGSSGLEWQSLTIALFAIVAAAVHIAPTALTGSTHLVKTAFTFVAMHDAPLWAQCTIAATSLIPYFAPDSEQLKQLELVGGTARQLYSAYFLYTAYMASNLTELEVAVMAVCKVIYRVERSTRITAGKREAFGLLHSFEHIDLYLYILVAFVPLAVRPEQWFNLGFLLAAALMAALVPLRSGDGLKALLGGLMLVFADYNYYKVYWLTIGTVMVYCKSRGANPHVGFSWSRVQGLYMATILLACHIAHNSYGTNGIVAVVVTELVLLLFGVHEQRPDVWSSIWYGMVLTGLLNYPYHFGAALICSFADILDLRFMGRMNAGIHLVVFGLYACRHFAFTPIVIGCVLICNASMFFFTNIFLGITSKPPAFIPEDIHKFFWKKLRGNALAFNPVGYLLKPFSPMLSWEYMNWARIDELTETIDWDGFDADLVVGVLSGGAFICDIVARRHPNSERGIIKSQVWSCLTARENLKSIGQVFMDKDAWRYSKTKQLHWEVSPPEDTDFQRILIVDDSVSSGKTMTNVYRFVKEAYPDADIRVFVLFAPSKSAGTDAIVNLNYVGRRGRVPMLWPWGVEMD